MFIFMNLSDEKLLSECKIETFRSSGKGGQHVNKTDSAVRLKHLPTGIAVTSQAQRSQYLNKLQCLGKLRRKMAILSFRPPKRIATKRPKSFKEQILKKKKRHSALKWLRGNPFIDE